MRSATSFMCMSAQDAPRADTNRLAVRYVSTARRSAAVCRLASSSAYALSSVRTFTLRKSLACRGRCAGLQGYWARLSITVLRSNRCGTCMMLFVLSQASAHKRTATGAWRGG